MVDYLNRENPELVINLGDLIEVDFNNYQAIIPELNKLNMPVYHVLGNHDYEINESKKDSLYNIFNLERGYYDISKAGWKFIILDGNDLSYHAIKRMDSKYQLVDSLFEASRKAGKEQARKWNGGLGVEQLIWLENNLKKASKAGEKVVLFCHYPVFPPNIHNLWNAEHIVKILEKYDCVKAYFSGHNHEGNYDKKSGIHYLTLKAMVQTADSTAFSVFEFHRDSVVVNGMGREISKVLKLDN